MYDHFSWFVVINRETDSKGEISVIKYKSHDFSNGIMNLHIRLNWRHVAFLFFLKKDNFEGYIYELFGF